MGFDYRINIHISISTETGLPFIWGPNFEQLPYVPEKHAVPVHLRKYLEGQGRFFKSYMPEDYIETVENWIDQFPSWETICEEYDEEQREEYEWTEKEHEEFKELLQWLNKNLYANVSWSS